MGKNKHKNQNNQNQQQAADPPPDPGVESILHDGKVWDRVIVPGLLNGFMVRRHIPAGTPTLEYLGPRIPQNLWAQVLSYFKWANETHHCEVQVRGFLNTAENAWKFWAFPQEKGGMSTKEISGPESDDQRARIGAGWDEFMTAHSHCSMSAFQSGTDKDDEVGRPGLHITIGHLDKEKFDIDARASFILGGNRVHYRSVNLGEWFEDPEYLRDAPERLINSISDEILDSIFLESLVTLPAGMVDFPEQWRANLIDRPAWTPGAGSAGGRKTWEYNHAGGFFNSSNAVNEKELLRDLLRICALYNMTEDELAEMIPWAEEVKLALTRNGLWDFEKAQSILNAAIISGEIGKIQMEVEEEARESEQIASGVI